MPLQEKKSFIQDPEPDMTAEDKNMHLSAKLAVAPYRRMQIVRIDRIEIGASGWQIVYRTFTEQKGAEQSSQENASNRPLTKGWFIHPLGNRQALASYF